MAERYEVVVTSEAEKSLEQIIQYLEEEVSYQTADRVRLALLQAIEKLEYHPESNGIVQEISDDEIRYRRVLVWSYRIIYTIEESVKIVFILDVDHANRDPEKLKEDFK